MTETITNIAIVGWILNLSWFVITIATALVMVLNLQKNDPVEHRKVMLYLEELQHLRIEQRVFTHVIPFYGFALNGIAFKILMSENTTLYQRFILIEQKLDKLRIFKRSK